MSDLVGNPEDRFSHNEAQLEKNTCIIYCAFLLNNFIEAKLRNVFPQIGQTLSSVEIQMTNKMFLSCSAFAKVVTKSGTI